ncbi:MAG: sulfatase-like hydrolase/transferase, partial [Planctomycetaceae bacterium]|nr:sulfatase-like hydrolase/transferase [Planctomycetaceae bacterium]
MKTRYYLLLLILLLCETIAVAGEKPNVLFIITEDTHWNVFGCYGNAICKTPNIDKLAASGIR